MPLSLRVKEALGLGLPRYAYSRLWRAIVAEYVATTDFVFFACASVVVQVPNGPPQLVGTLVAGFVQGLAIAALVAAVSKASGGHINPAVTFAMMVTGDFPILPAFAYIVVQLAGGITGAAILSGILPGQIEGELGTTQLSNGVSRFQGYLFESMVTFMLVFTIYGTSIHNARDNWEKTFAPTSIGFALMVGVTVAYNFTGGSLNPARTFGPAVISHTWGDNYIYWFGPITGAIIAALFFKYIIGRMPPVPVAPDAKYGGPPVHPYNATGTAAGGNGSTNNSGMEQVPNPSIFNTPVGPASV